MSNKMHILTPHTTSMPKTRKTSHSRYHTGRTHGTWRSSNPQQVGGQNAIPEQHLVFGPHHPTPKHLSKREKSLSLQRSTCSCALLPRSSTLIQPPKQLHIHQPTHSPAAAADLGRKGSSQNGERMAVTSWSISTAKSKGLHYRVTTRDKGFYFYPQMTGNTARWWSDCLTGTKPRISKYNV